MDEFVPTDVAELIASIEAKKDKAFRAVKRAEEAEAARLRRIEELRQSRRVELITACLKIDDWIGRFEETAAPAIWRLNGGVGIVIFSARFMRNEPESVDLHANAQLRLGPRGKKASERLVYEELYTTTHGTTARKTPLLSAAQMWRKLHPDFVTRCATRLSGPEAWEHVRRELERLNGK